MKVIDKIVALLDQIDVSKFKRPSWQEMFMFTAINVATRHSCLKRGVGAVIVKEKRIIGTGYNGAASGIEQSCLELGYCYYESLAEDECEKNKLNYSLVKEQFKMYSQAVHAEVNAASQCTPEELKGASLFVTNFPCPSCSQNEIINKKIKQVYVHKDYLSNPALSMDEKRASERKLMEAGVSVNSLRLSKRRIMEIACYMALVVGERTSYQYKLSKGG